MRSNAFGVIMSGADCEEQICRHCISRRRGGEAEGRQKRGREAVWDDVEREGEEEKEEKEGRTNKVCLYPPVREERARGKSGLISCVPTGNIQPEGGGERRCQGDWTVLLRPWTMDHQGASSMIARPG